MAYGLWAKQHEFSDLIFSKFEDGHQHLRGIKIKLKI